MGIIISVLRNAELGDCTNGGISSKYSRLCLVNAYGPFEPSNDKCPLVLMENHARGCVRIVPAYMHVDSLGTRSWRPVPLMFTAGGNYGACSDSRFTELVERLLGHPFYGAVAIHDRIE